MSQLTIMIRLSWCSAHCEKSIFFVSEKAPYFYVLGENKRQFLAEKNIADIYMVVLIKELGIYESSVLLYLFLPELLLLQSGKQVRME